MCRIHVSTDANTGELSVLDGDVVVVVSSFTATATESNLLPMRSVSFVEYDENQSQQHFATPLTDEILRGAIKWLVGEDESMSLERMLMLEGLKIYLDLLSSKIQKDMSMDNLVGFIQNHRWSLSTGSPQIRELIATLTNRRNSPLMTHFNQESSINDGYRLQCFIHENLAKETKIVIHTIDGIHRVAALDCALVGFEQNCSEGGTVGQELPSNIINYASVLPHKEKAIKLKVYYLLKDFYPGLLQQYRALSSQIQQMMGQ